MKLRILHCGCGPHAIRSSTADWVNVDIELHHNPDITMDCTKMSEVFPENSFDGLFSCHSLEHYPWDAGVRAFFREAKKILKPGAIMRIIVPDLMLVAKKYVAGEDLKDIYDGPYYEGIDCPAERFKAFCRLWEHSVLFDYRLIKFLAEEAGFTNCQKMDFNVSRLPELSGHDRFRSESLILECQA